jgi:hypothetical protein
MTIDTKIKKLTKYIKNTPCFTLTKKDSMPYFNISVEYVIKRLLEVIDNLGENQ